jgi:hypothetical protein
MKASAIEDINWNRLKAFHASATVGSFTHAAKLLGTSQSAMSRAVGGLERDLAAKLFRPHGGRGIVLTRAGQDLYRIVSEGSPNPSTDNERESSEEKAEAETGNSAQEAVGATA